MKPPPTTTTYRLTMSDGTPVTCEAESAGHAIEWALRENRGRTVVRCYSGLSRLDCVLIRKMDPDKNPMEGITEHDVPPHDAIDPEAILLKRMKPATLRQLPDPGTVTMFPP